MWREGSLLLWQMEHWPYSTEEKVRISVIKLKQAGQDCGSYLNSIPSQERKSARLPEYKHLVKMHSFYIPLIQPWSRNISRHLHVSWSIFQHCLLRFSEKKKESVKMLCSIGGRNAACLGAHTLCSCLKHVWWDECIWAITSITGHSQISCTVCVKGAPSSSWRQCLSRSSVQCRAVRVCVSSGIGLCGCRRMELGFSGSLKVPNRWSFHTAPGQFFLW